MESLIHNPVKLLIHGWDSNTKSWYQKQVIFLGEQSNEVKTAVLNPKPLKSQKILKEWFGNDYKYKLSITNEVTGGDDFPDTESTTDDPLMVSDVKIPNIASEGEKILLTEMVESIPGEGDYQITMEDLNPGVLDNLQTAEKRAHTEVTYSYGEYKPNISETIINIPKEKTYIWDINLFPDDKISEVKLKINKILEIPIFRQHLWYMKSGYAVPLKYQLYEMENITHVVDFYNSVIQMKDKMDKVYDMPIDMVLYQNKEVLKIEAYDNFEILGNLLGVTNLIELHLVDLETFIQPYRSEMIKTLLDDKYQMQILYYGFIIKYWPMMDLASFIEYVETGSLKNSYPELDPPKENLAYLEKMDSIQQDLVNSFVLNKNRIKRIEQIFINALTETTLKVTSPWKNKIINLRLLFDLFPLNSVVDAIRLYDVYQGQHIFIDKFIDRRSYEKLIPGVLYFRIVINRSTGQKLNMFLYPNGAYAIKAAWGEDQALEFDDVHEIVYDKVVPLLREINSLAGKIMYHGSKIQLPIISKENVKFIDISISSFWKKTLATKEFDILKSWLKKFVDAHILIEKEIDKNTIIYYFKKGMYEFDPRRIEKTISVDNYYSYLTNSDIRQKWITLFETVRIFKVTHRFNDIKFEISGIKEDEYLHYSRYLVLLMHMFMVSRPVESSEVTKEDMDRKHKKPLSNLKEQDPHLYNFKKIYNADIVYSKLCQKPFQPILLAQNQYDILPHTEKKNITKYWNFTTSTDAYYQCPNPAYPNLRFLTGKHPKNYCIPCCKITAPSNGPNNKQKQIYSECIKNHIWDPKTQVSNQGSSRYIMSYGKTIEPGRLSFLPEQSLEALLFDNETNFIINTKYYLFGIDQNLDLGYFNILIHALKFPTYKEFIEYLRILFKKYSNFENLLGGQVIEYWQSADDMLDDLTSLVGKKLLKKHINFKKYNELFIDIAEKILKIFNWNPIYLIHKDAYFKIHLIERRLFKVGEPAVNQVIEMVKKVKPTQTDSSYNQIYDYFTLDVLNKFLQSPLMKGKYIIDKIYSNKDNLCYGVKLKPLGFIPLHLSYFKKSDFLDFSADWFRQDLPSMSNLIGFTKEWNDWVYKESFKWGSIKIDVSIKRPMKERIEPLYPILEQEKLLISPKGKCIGFISQSLNFYILATNNIPSGILKIQINYEPQKINTLLQNVNFTNSVDGRKSGINSALYKKYKYHLIILYFINEFNKQKNEKIRHKLKQTILKGFTKDIQTSLMEIIPDGSANDIETLKSQILESQLSGEKKAILIDKINNSYYEFDITTLDKLKKLPQNQVKMFLAKIAKTFTTTVKTDYDMPNILSVSKSKLYMQSGELDKYLEILSSQFKNPFMEKYLFSPIFQDVLIDYFKFTRREGENIEIEFLMP